MPKPAYSQQYDEDGFEIEIPSPDSNNMDCDPDFDSDCRPNRPTLEKLPNMEKNPLKPVGDELDILLKHRLKEGLWESILDELPCADLSPQCVRELQQMAVDNSLAIQEIDFRVEEVDERIAEARSKNSKVVLFEIFSPALQYYLASEEPSSFDELQNESYQVEVPTTEVRQIPTVQMVPVVKSEPVEVTDPETGEIRIEQRQTIVEEERVTTQPEIIQSTRIETRQRQVPKPRRGPLTRILADLRSPWHLANNILNLVGIPFAEKVLGGSEKQQRRAIAIGDLQVKLAELQRSRAEVAQALRLKVSEILLDTDAAAKEFQIAQEVGIRDTNRLMIAKINYQYGEGDSESYLAKISAHDRQKAQVLRTFNIMRGNLEKLKVLVLSPE